MKPAEGSTVIGKAITIRGELSGKEDVYLDGVVEGTISLLESQLTVGQSARVQADVAVRDVVIHGTVEGNIRATGRIELRESGAVRGDIIAGRLSIEENASIKGRVELADKAGTGQPAIAQSGGVQASIGQAGMSQHKGVEFTGPATAGRSQA
jgi:cytoskeletal protein CcmA (bactofilin family)